jgi:hypothetical protein
MSLCRRDCRDSAFCCETSHNLQYKSGHSRIVPRIECSSPASSLHPYSRSQPRQPTSLACKPRWSAIAIPGIGIVVRYWKRSVRPKSQRPRNHHKRVVVCSARPCGPEQFKFDVSFVQRQHGSNRIVWIPLRLPQDPRRPQLSGRSHCSRLVFKYHFSFVQSWRLIMWQD